MSTTNEVECTLCETLFEDEAAFDSHQHIVCNLEGLVAKQRVGKTIYALPNKNADLTITIDW